MEALPRPDRVVAYLDNVIVFGTNAAAHEQISGRFSSVCGGAILNSLPRKLKLATMVVGALNPDSLGFSIPPVGVRPNAKR